MLMFVMIAAGGLTMTASMGPIAKDFKIDKNAGRAARLHDAGAGLRDRR
jgi:hypothetical protein